MAKESADKCLEVLGELPYESPILRAIALMVVERDH